MTKVRFSLEAILACTLLSIVSISCVSSRKFRTQLEISTYNSEYLFFAHKGVLYLYPENTMSAFKEAERIGCKGIELDIRASADGVIVISHDGSVNKMTNKFGAVSKYDYETLHSMKINNNTKRLSEPEHIATLEEYLAWVKDTNIYTNIELKTGNRIYPDIEKKAVALVEKYKLQDKVIFSSTNLISLALVKRFNSEIKTGWIADISEENVYLASSLGFSAIHTGSNVNSDLITMCHESNLQVNCFTEAGPDMWLRLFNLGVDSITTDFYYDPE